MKDIKRINQLMLPVLSFSDRTVCYIKFVSEFMKSQFDSQDDDKRTPATTAKVLNLEDGKYYRMIAPAMLVSIMQDYNEAIVGKCYEVHVSEKPVPGKRYKKVEVWEIECPAEYKQEGAQVNLGE